MQFTVNPVAFVHATRQEATDDYWGGEQATIELAADLPDESLDGIDAFSHAEILFVFDKLDPEAVIVGARHPRGNAAWPRVGIFAQRAKARPNRVGRRSSGSSAVTAGASSSAVSTRSTVRRSSTSNRCFRSSCRPGGSCSPRGAAS